MGTYASYSDVAARLPYRTIGASSKPTSTQVEQWITEAEAMLTGALARAGISYPVTGGGAEIMKSWAADFAEGRTRQAYAAAGGDGGNDDGKDLIEAFRDLVRVQIPGDPPGFEAMLWTASSSTTRRLRGHVLDNADGLTISDGDFAPTFTKSDAEDQF